MIISFPIFAARDESFAFLAIGRPYLAHCDFEIRFEWDRIENPPEGGAWFRRSFSLRWNWPKGKSNND